MLSQNGLLTTAHNLSLVKEGYQTLNTTISVNAGQTKILPSFRLTLGTAQDTRSGSVYIASVPTNATIYLDGVKSGITDKFLTGVSAGTHNLTLVKEGYQTLNTTVTVKAGQNEILPSFRLILL